MVMVMNSVVSDIALALYNAADSVLANERNMGRIFDYDINMNKMDFTENIRIQMNITSKTMEMREFGFEVPEHFIIGKSVIDSFESQLKEKIELLVLGVPDTEMARILYD